MITITPEIAAAYLDVNAGNRPLTSSHVDNLSSAMSRGEWIFNGDSVRIANSGRLIDGQHRLNAIIKCGIPQKMMVVSGLDDKAFLTIDCGRLRQPADTLAIKGFKHTSALSSAARFLMNINSGHTIHGKGSAQKYTSTQILETVINNPNLAVSAAYGSSKRSRKYIGPALLAFCHYWFIKHDYIAGTEFFNEIESGEYSYKFSPIAALKEKLIDNAVSTKKLNRDEKAAYVFAAFNKYLNGEQVKRLNLKHDSKDWLQLG